MTAERTESASGEFARGWPVVLGAIIGIAIGIILPVAAISVFMHDLQAEFGWTRTQISLGPTMMFVTIAVLSPLYGWIADRMAPRFFAGFSLAALSVGLYLFSHLGGDIYTYYVGFVALAVAAGGSASIVYAKAVSANFSKNLGLALALAMLGAGISQVLSPLLLTPYAAAAGWRAGFVALALVVAVGTPFVFLLIGAGNHSIPAPAVRAKAPKALAPIADVLRSRVFWTMAVCFVLIPLAATGLNLHLLTYLADAGVNPVRAGIIASSAGVAMIVARLCTGILIDRLFAPYVAAAMMGAAALGIASMELLGPDAAILGAIAIGISVGAELDLVGYMAKRYFGIERFGRVYGILYGTVLAGMSLSKVGYGVLADATGSYQMALFIATALLVASALLFLTLPSFRHEA